MKAGIAGLAAEVILVEGRRSGMSMALAVEGVAALADVGLGGGSMDLAAGQGGCSMPET
jgi:hypothetical protein